ncbi:MAG TPA: hypothetical protein PKC51_09045, partial [Ferruginibacter sp.]|nr:hypothetical protein [Ferruginibacter sp.]
ENALYVRFKLTQQIVDLEQIELVTYENTLLGYNDLGAWQTVGQYSLTEDTQETFRRLEDTARFKVDKLWGKFNDMDQGSGAFTVKVKNYESRWNLQDTGIKHAVTTYLKNSEDGSPAKVMVKDQDNISQELNYLNLLQWASLDFHVARMLGLGCVDPMAPAAQQKPFIYLSSYTTEAELEKGNGVKKINHIFLSLPTTQTDFRYPTTPVLQPPVYGLTVDNGTPYPSLLSDPNGYLAMPGTPKEYVRYINLRRGELPYERMLTPFYQFPQEYSNAVETIPVMYGLEYREDSEKTYRKPELLHDDNYKDHKGYPEVVPIPELGDFRVYSHMETEEGVHWYALYSINWFSRVSPLSNAVKTNKTQFPRRNSLLPPFNFAVQLIQPEDPRLFTTQLEQDMLAKMTAADKTLLRVTFDWNQNHHQAYQFADYVELFFRTKEPLVIQGEVDAVVETGNRQVKVSTRAIPIASTSAATSIVPSVAAADIAKFTGSLLVANEVAYEVVSVTSGTNPEFILKKVRKTNVSDPDGKGNYLVTEDFIKPQAGDRFLVYENLSGLGSWEYQFGVKVPLSNFTPLYKETLTLPNGKT